MTGLRKGDLIVGDGSWNLSILVTDLQVQRTLRVKGDLHIGGVMIRLVDELDIAMDWSDHAMWWPDKNIWLDKTRWTLDQYNITADAEIHFTPMHKMLRVQLPDLRYIDCNVDFSVKTFNACINLCKELGIRHPEEMSLCKALEPEHLKKNYQETVMMKRKHVPLTKEGNQRERIDTNTFIQSQNGKHSQSSTNLNGTLMSSPRTPTHQINGAAYHSNPGTLRNGNYSPYNNGHSPVPGTLKSSTLGQKVCLCDSLGTLLLDHSPAPSPEVRSLQLHPKTLVERARMNVGWLDSSLSIMEQGINQMDTLLLRFKYYAFYDLNPKQDSVRINQIYEQAKWQILNEELDCTEEEMLLFAALQLQVGMQANVPQPHELYDEDDDIDAALSELQVSLEGSMGALFANDVTQVPQLADYIRFFKPKRFTLKSFKTLYFVCRDLTLRAYKSIDASRSGSEPVLEVNLKGCEVTPEVQLSNRKYQIKLEIPSTDGMTEMWLRLSNEAQYARWMAACRLAAKGKNMADPSFDAEVKSIQAFLSMQHPAAQPVINPSSIDTAQLEQYVAPRFIRKMRSKLRQKILEAHANVKDLNLLEAKMNFIKAWQSLPDYGVSLFVVRFHGEKKEELLGVASNKIMRMTLNTGDHVKTWRFSTMKAWNINWETRHMMIQFEDEKNVIFHCLSADCKVVHEFIGGYIFLLMRSKENNQQLNEELFHKLTGGWV